MHSVARENLHSTSLDDDLEPGRGSRLFFHEIRIL